MTGDEREIKLKELGVKLGLSYWDYCVFSGDENGYEGWDAGFMGFHIKGYGATIAKAEIDLIEKLERYIDSGRGEIGETQGT